MSRLKCSDAETPAGIFPASTQLRIVKFQNCSITAMRSTGKCRSWRHTRSFPVNGSMAFLFPVVYGA